MAEFNLTQKLQKIFWIIVETMGIFMGIDVMELVEDIFRDTNASEKLKQLNVIIPKEKIYDKAAWKMLKHKYNTEYQEYI
ncbi:MAG: hypothetical protein JEZ09_15920 [Salinivirgaceae bacterium]|nr:hypothetical protein [Salinivirgaceae bacterium]